MTRRHFREGRHTTAQHPLQTQGDLRNRAEQGSNRQVRAAKGTWTRTCHKAEGDARLHAGKNVLVTVKHKQGLELVSKHAFILGRGWQVREAGERQ